MSHTTPRPRAIATWALALGLVAALAACSSGSAGSSTTTTGPDSSAGAPKAVRSTVFELGQGGVDTYRIPALAVTPDHTIVAIAEARTLSPADGDPHSLVARRSTDGGRTWSKVTELAAAVAATTCFPSDPVTIVPESGSAMGDVIVVYRPCRSADGLASVRSTDGGATWSEPAALSVDLGTSLTQAQYEGMRPGPGNGVQLQEPSGRLAFVADSNMAAGTSTVLGLFLSDDGGETWKVGATRSSGDGEERPDESALAVASDGNVVISSRGAAPQRLAYLASPDGEEFLPFADGSTVKVSTGLSAPDVEGSLLTLDDGTVVLATPSDPAIRRGLRLYELDGEARWKAGRMVEAGGAAYSSLARYDDDTFLVLAEVGNGYPYAQIDLIPITGGATGKADPLATADPRRFAGGRALVDDVSYPITRWCIADPVMELKGGTVAIDISRGLEAVEVDAKVEDFHGKPLELTGTVPVTVDVRLYRGPLQGSDGKEHQVDLVLGYGTSCG